MYCFSCGNELDKSVKYCNKCGEKQPKSKQIISDFSPSNKQIEPERNLSSNPINKQSQLVTDKSPTVHEDKKAVSAKKNKKWYTNLLSGVAVLVGIIIFSTAGTIGKEVGRFLGSDKGDGSISEQAKSFFSNNDIKPYTSTAEGFTINFPGFPNTEKDTLDLQGYVIPYTNFLRLSENEENVFQISVIDYSPLPSEQQLSLDGAVNGVISNIEGAKPGSSIKSMMGGNESVQGDFTAPIDGKVYDGHVEATLNGRKMYAILTIGATTQQFEDFVSSFKFN